VRAIMPLDRNWLFNKGDAAGADAAAFPDSAWRPVNVPHDWAVEGPFAQDAATTGRGAYLPSGIGWYRTHFTLPASVTAGKQVYIEFDGVMGNSTVYINGTQLGNHPYGYVSFRYDMTKTIKFGAENVLAVKTDTSIQPASRFYAGAGIYRRVRIIATDPVHIDQYATFVNSPSPTAASATVHVTTSVVNSGTSSQSVSVEAVVSPAGSAALAPVSAAAQTIAAGASASFAMDVSVANPKLWDLETPNMYQVLTNVLVGGTTVDDDVTPFGIRDLKFSGGMTLNGKSLKFQGVANHQDYHGLGMAAPARAMQRRLAQLKAIGVNATLARVSGFDRPDGFSRARRVHRRVEQHEVPGQGRLLDVLQQGLDDSDRNAVAAQVRHRHKVVGGRFYRLDHAGSQPPQRCSLQHGQRNPRFDELAYSDPHRDGRHQSRTRPGAL
jgi:beta-galactosidase